MYQNFKSTKLRIATSFLLLMATAASIMLVASCTNTLDGEKTANAMPVVYFVNIPPDGQRFSRNPVVYWVGSDEDGQIDYYRYHVVEAADLGTAEPEEYIATIANDEWIYLDVDHTEADPRTTNTLDMSADLDDPVNTFVDQYVFLQGYDEEGLGSAIVYRLFSRNNNPPQTLIYGVGPDSPFVNAEVPGGIISGVKLRWAGFDPLDYPSDPPPFEYEWQLFGPYTQEEFFGVNGVMTKYATTVYVTSDARVFQQGDEIERCDTIFIGEIPTIECDTILVTPDVPTTALGGLEPILLTADTGFINAGLYRVADSSGDGVNTWVTGTADTIYDVYNRYMSPGEPGELIDTTVEMAYVFQIRSRDDAQVPDLTPAFRPFTVINPAHEREICVIDFTKYKTDLSCYKGLIEAKAYWNELMQGWKATHSEFDSMDSLEFFNTIQITNEGGSPYRKQAKDYLIPEVVTPRLVELLKHKVIIIVLDDIRSRGFEDKADAIYTAIDAGLNVWITARALTFGAKGVCSNFQVAVSPNYTRYFGVAGIAYAGYHSSLATASCQYYQGNTAAFVGAYSIDAAKWPDIVIDSARLHSNYHWDGNGAQFDWDPNVPALPEVGWAGRAFGTEVMYLYKSIYGNSHPLGFEFNFEGSPVAHRLFTTQYKTVHFSFTLPAMEQESVKELAFSVLDWLYPDGELGDATSSVVDRYKDASIRISLEEAQENFRQRRLNRVDSDDMDMNVTLR